MERRADWLVTVEPKEGRGGVFPGFSLCLLYPGPGAVEAGTQKHQWRRTREKTRKACPLKQRTRNDVAWQDRKCLDNNNATLKKAPKIQLGHQLHPHQQRPSGEPTFPPSPCCHEAPPSQPPSTTGWCYRWWGWEQRQPPC